MAMSKETRKLIQKSSLRGIIKKAERLLATCDGYDYPLEELHKIQDILNEFEMNFMKYKDMTENEKCKAEIKAMHEKYDRA